MDPELALVAEKVIVTAEKVVPRLEKADLIGPAVDFVVEVPGGAWPTSCHPLYPLDGQATLEFTEVAGTETYAGLLADWFKHHGLEPPG